MQGKLCRRVKQKSIDHGPSSQAQWIPDYASPYNTNNIPHHCQVVMRVSLNGTRDRRIYYIGIGTLTTYFSAAETDINSYIKKAKLAECILKLIS